MLSYDMVVPCIIPNSLYMYALEAEDRWGYLYATGVNLFKHYSKISLQQEILLQRDSYDNCVDDDNIVSC